jgi:glycosyltransferase involved in cell wall biosynthesis
VCAPPVDLDFFSGSAAPREDFLLAVGALVPYKRFELAIDAAARLGRPLVVVGKGPERARLEKEAGSSVQILVDRTGEELRDLYRRCAALVQPGEEDFGIAAVEALACGAPVVALRRGGVLDIVEDGQTGVLVAEEGAAALAEGIARAAGITFDYTRLRERAGRFRRARFIEEFRRQIEIVQR